MAKFKDQLILLLGIILGLLSIRVPTDRWIQALSIVTPNVCERPRYEVRIISFDPLIMHLENFVTERERRGIIASARPKLEPSHLLSKNGTKSFSTHRTSSSAPVPHDLPAARCVLDRFASFQGFVPLADVESLQLTAYQPGQQFKPHMDWGTNASNADTGRWRRATTGFAVLDATCRAGGATQFPRIPTNWTAAAADGEGAGWCRIVDCAQDVLTVRPLPGSLLFWQNTRSDGVVDRRMLHAGMPPEDGSKVGLNIWTKIDLWDGRVGSRTGQEAAVV